MLFAMNVCSTLYCAKTNIRSPGDYGPIADCQSANCSYCHPLRGFRKSIDPATQLGRTNKVFAFVLYSCYKIPSPPCRRAILGRLQRWFFKNIKEQIQGRCVTLFRRSKWQFATRRFSEKSQARAPIRQAQGRHCAPENCLRPSADSWVDWVTLGGNG